MKAGDIVLKVNTYRYLSVLLRSTLSEHSDHAR